MNFYFETEITNKIKQYNRLYFYIQSQDKNKLISFISCVITEYDDASLKIFNLSRTKISFC
jgi:hypothetical protein